MPYAIIFLTAVVVEEVVGLGWVLLLRAGYQLHERRAYGFPDYRLPLWAKAYWTAILTLLFLALALAGQATMWMAVFADMGASLLVVGNGLRLLRK